MENNQAEIRVGGKRVLADKKGELKIDEAYQNISTFKLNLQKPGQYPLTLVMHYTDANQYPFSALTAQTFVYQKEAVSTLFGQLKSVTISKEGKLTLTIKNLGDTEAKTKTYLVAPRELTVEEKPSEFKLGPKSAQDLSFIVKNFSALAGSTYQVFAVSEAEDADFHYTNVFPGTVKIVEKNIFANYQIYFFALIIVLLVVFVAFQFKKK